MTIPRSIRASVVQPHGIPFDAQRSVDRVCELTADAARERAQLVLFPEAFIGGYPWGLAFGTSVGGRTPAGRRTWERYWQNAIDVPGAETRQLGEAAREHAVYLAAGVIERDSTFSRGTLYCTLLYFGPDGSLLGKHRKLKPTAA
jgi:nitrilase